MRQSLLSRRFRLCFTGLSLALSSLYLHAESVDTNADSGEGFAQCISRIETHALAQGIAEPVVKDALGSVKHIERVIGYDRNQPEFVQTFKGYVEKRVNQWRIDRGRQMLKQHKALLETLTKTYGIPGHYLVAFWGLETNFGAYKGKMPIVDSLATLACDQRRSEFFTRELLQALRLMERERFDTDVMQGSWAGAMGHTQFMPSAYLRYGKDGDGDGRVDLWNSVEDALTSAANFLQHLGWTGGYRWGREVKLPDAFDYQLAGKHQAPELTFWEQQGLTRVDGNGIGSGELPASLLVPAGHKGPAFLVYPNFDVIMGWNNSEFYAIAVGYLADRLIGAKPFSVNIPDLPPYTLDQVKALQMALNQRGYDVGDADGIMGPATRRGIRAFQASREMIADGFPDQQVMAALEVIPADQS